MGRILVWGLFSLLLSLGLMSKEGFSQAPAKQGKSSLPDPKEMEQRQKEWQEQELEFLKRQNPQEYEKRKKIDARQEKIAEIVNSWRENRIALTEAERQLYPLVKEDLQDYLSSLDSEITRLEKRSDFLKKVKKDPAILIQKHIGQLLGKGGFSPEDIW